MNIVAKHNQKAFIFLLKSELGFFGVAAVQSAAAFQIVESKLLTAVEVCAIGSQKDAFAKRGVQVIDLTNLNASEASSHFKSYTSSPIFLLNGTVLGVPTYSYFQPHYSYFDITSFEQEVFLTTQKTRGPNK